MMSEIKIGDTIQATFQAIGGEQHIGRVIKIIKPNTALTEGEVATYAGIGISHPDYINIRGERCPIYRVVVEVGEYTYAIVPLHSRMWDYEILETAEEEKDMSYIKCNHCQYIHCESDIIAPSWTTNLHPMEVEAHVYTFQCKGCGKEVNISARCEIVWEVIDEE